MRETAKTPKGKVTAEALSKTLVAAWADRACIIFTNYGAQPVAYALGSTATYEEGPMMVKEGGSVMLEGYNGPIAVIAKESTSVVGYTEY